MKRARLFAACVGLMAPAWVHAQGTNPLELTLLAGAGATLSLAQPGVARRGGPALLGGVEFARPSRSRLVGRMALRVEAGFASQAFSVDQGAVSGDVHTVHAALALRMDLLDRGARALVPYALAGAAWARPSTRFALRQGARTIPGAGFEQVTHENVPGAIVGAGVAWHTPRADVRAEARWMTLRTTERASRTLPLLVMIAVPLHR